MRDCWRGLGAGAGAPRGLTSTQLRGKHILVLLLLWLTCPHSSPSPNYNPDHDPPSTNAWRLLGPESTCLAPNLDNKMFMAFPWLRRPDLRKLSESMCIK